MIKNYIYGKFIINGCDSFQFLERVNKCVLREV